jgi:hypothetical protein
MPVTLRRVHLRGRIMRWKRSSATMSSVLALSWLGFLEWLGTLLLAIGLVVAVVVLVLYLREVSGSE